MVSVLAGAPRSSARLRRYIFLTLLASTGITVLYSVLSYAVLPDRATPGFQDIEQEARGPVGGLVGGLVGGGGAGTTLTLVGGELYAV